MSKFTISDLYINEAKRLRSKYFEVTQMIYDKKDQLLKYAGELDVIHDQIEQFDIENEKQLEFKIKEYQEQIENNMQRIRKTLKPDYDKLRQIEEDTKILYDSISEKYKGITTEEIKIQIIPHLI